MPIHPTRTYNRPPYCGSYKKRGNRWRKGDRVVAIIQTMYVDYKRETDGKLTTLSGGVDVTIVDTAQPGVTVADVDRWVSAEHEYVLPEHEHVIPGQSLTGLDDLIKSALRLSQIRSYVRDEKPPYKTDEERLAEANLAKAFKKGF